MELVSQRILQLAHSDLPLTSFLRETVQLLRRVVGCDSAELWVRRNDRCLCCEVRGPSRGPQAPGGPRAVDVCRLVQAPRELLDDICRWLEQQRAAAEGWMVSRSRSHWTRDGRRASAVGPSSVDGKSGKPRRGAAQYRSLAILPLDAAGRTIGVLHVRNRRTGSICEARVDGLEQIARTLSVALLNQLAQCALRERIKELTCLYCLAQLADAPDATVAEILQGIVELLPSAWQYPEIAAARVVLDGSCYRTAGFRAFVHRQSADVVVNGERRGRIDVVYRERRPELDEGPFLEEERTLLETVARHTALIVERRHAAQEKSRLKDQLRHADRLATIGQLAAGVAHELNEPLGNILAFAQLAEKQPGLPSQAQQDLGRIVATSLYAREIIKKLMLFARQMPLQKSAVDLNAVVEEGLSFLGARCAKRGVRVRLRLAKDLPPITADPSQLNQVLVNLVVNALHAMPNGGTLRIATRSAGGQVMWTVEDDGIGMSAEALQKVFLPFYTTKDVHEGTGLGLPVVHGIVTSHGGTIAVHSAAGRGARFEIRLPLRAPQAVDGLTGDGQPT